jgi:hypothetical protein
MLAALSASGVIDPVAIEQPCKRPQMRWTPRGAHLLVQVRCAVLNGDILEKWKEWEKAKAELIDPEVQQFLERSQLAAA